MDKDLDKQLINKVLRFSGTNDEEVLHLLSSYLVTNRNFKYNQTYITDDVKELKDAILEFQRAHQLFEKIENKLKEKIIKLGLSEDDASVEIVDLLKRGKELEIINNQFFLSPYFKVKSMQIKLKYSFSKEPEIKSENKKSSNSEKEEQYFEHDFEISGKPNISDEDILSEVQSEITYFTNLISIHLCKQVKSISK
ncbi:MAG: hypothetical protein JEZ14_08980 [Marinilabiliaceae bacterium]|nr:hypothetical protein [Marinilabiliaceae bacterium]